MADRGNGFTIATSAEEAARLQRPPSLTILTRTRIAAPEFPIDVFGPFWSTWISRTATGANAATDYVALPLLVTISALIGNSRWVQAWPTWAEPPILWGASVGNPSSGKTPGATPVVRDVLARVEMHMCRDYEADAEAWSEAATVASAIEKQWTKDVAKAVKAGSEIPPKPSEAQIRDKPARPRASVSDATIESLAQILASQPKGVLHVRDELAAWLSNLGRYANGGSDRPFWLEAYVGGRHRVDRQKNPEPIIIDRLSIATFGTIQPDRLADTLAGVDDGLPGRFLWVWPETGAEFSRPSTMAFIREAAERMIKLADLAMMKGEEGRLRPSFTSLDNDAANLLEAFAREMQVAETVAHGMMKTAIGKARGQALRLALVLEYLWWIADGVIEPATVSAAAMAAGISMMRDYFLPMAQRVLGDAAIPVEERDARTLASWIAETRPDIVNVRSIREDAHLPGLRETTLIKVACRYLVDAGWLSKAPGTGQRGRPSGDFRVSPLLGPALDEMKKTQVRCLYQKAQNTQKSPAAARTGILGIMGILGAPPNRDIFSEGENAAGDEI